MHRFDTIARLFAQRASDRRLSRRQAVTRGGAGIAAGALAAAGLTATSAQNATPAPQADASDHGPTMLFLQTFQSGTIAAKEGAEGRYTLTLEAGHGQTIYFSDRPDRIVGTTPTSRFLEGLGFPDDNPPNAALVVETAAGETDIAVVELFEPHYDPASHGVTYEVEVLANWQTSLEIGFSAAPTDLATLASSFGSAHLFIDDCPDGLITCYQQDRYVGAISNEEHDGFCYSWSAWACLPCKPWFDGDIARTISYLAGRCNQLFSACGGNCNPRSICSAAWNCPA